MIIFSDLHYGIGQNGSQQLADTDACIDWMVELNKSAQQKICIFAGDWCHERSKVDVITALYAKAGLSKLCGAFGEVYCIPGNHDYYYNHNSTEHSLQLFGGVANNLHLVESPQLIEENGRKILLCPWFYNPAELAPKCDVLIGHFEFTGGRMKGMTDRSRKCGISDLLSVAKLVFTGHYHLTGVHIREEGSVVQIGSPLSLDWGDAGDFDKGVILLGEGDWERIINPFSPKMIEIDSEVLEQMTEEQLKEVFSDKLFERSHVKVISSGPIKQEFKTRLDSISDAVECRTLQVSGCGFDLGELQVGNLTTHKGIRQHVMEYVEELLKLEENAGIDPESIKSRLSGLFERIEEN